MSLPAWIKPRHLQKGLQDLGLATGVIPGHRDYRKFIILGRGRSGSNFLATSLSSHPQATCFGEIFHNWGRENGTINFQYPGYNGRDPKLLRLRDEQPVEFLDKAIFGRYPRRVQAVGFKLFYYHAQEADWKPVWDYLKQHNVLALHIQRTNYLQALVSETIAEITQTYSARQRTAAATSGAATKPVPEQIHLSVEDCRRHFEGIDNARAAFTGYFDSTLDVIYEDLLNNYDAELRKVQEFLGLPPRNVQSPLRKQGKRPAHEVISNFAELAEAFSDTPWAHFFQEASPEESANRASS